ncbi:MAG: EutN/CcmL family microcompartment protein [Acidobacteriota bacterium]
MILGRVAGTIVATCKDEMLRGKKLLIVQLIDPETGKPNSPAAYQVCVDTVGAGARETVITVSGSSARFSSGLADHPIDSAIVGIVDTIDLDKKGEP